MPLLQILSLESRRSSLPKLLVIPCVALAATAANGVAGAVDVAAHPDPLSALTCPDPKLAANKRLVFDL